MPNKIAGDLGLMDLGLEVRFNDVDGDVHTGTLAYIAFDLGKEVGEQVTIAIDTDEYGYSNAMFYVHPFTKLEIVEIEDDYEDEHHPSNPSALGWV